MKKFYFFSLAFDFSVFNLLPLFDRNWFDDPLDFLEISEMIDLDLSPNSISFDILRLLPLTNPIAPAPMLSFLMVGGSLSTFKVLKVLYCSVKL